MNHDLNQNLSNLKFISKIEVGDKINTRVPTIQKTTLMGRIVRTFINNDRRSHTLAFIQTVVNNAFRLYDSEEEYKPKIRDNLIDSKIGLRNLQQTYEEDIKFSCDIQTIIDCIDFWAEHKQD